jgi:hypothetical protein
VHSEPLGGLSMLSSVLQECPQEIVQDPVSGGHPEGLGPGAKDEGTGKLIGTSSRTVASR